MLRSFAFIIVLSMVILPLSAQAQTAGRDEPLVYETEDYTTPKDAWQVNKSSPTKWNLWSMDSDAKKKWSGGAVLQSPPVLKDRAAPEDGAPPLHTHITGIPPGRYEVTIKLGRALAVSADGKEWQKKEGSDNGLGVFDVANGTFDLWVDDRFASSESPGSAYYDCIVFTPVRPRVEKAKVEGFAKERVRERIDRGLVAMPIGEHRVYLGWRLLASDPEDVAFNVYRSSGGNPPEKLNAEPIRKTTDFVDTTAPLDAVCEYTVRAVEKGSEGQPLPSVRATASAQAQECIILKLDEGEKFQKVGIGDLDGDGRYDFVIKQPDENIDPAHSYWKPSPDTYKVEAYLQDGRRLWRKDLGWAIERGIWYSPMVVYDLDGDGKAEVAVKTGEGNPRDPDGHVTSGPEWISILDGLTGKERARNNWPSRMAAGEREKYTFETRNQLCIAYLDGKTPCLIVERGTYGVIQLVAYQFHDGSLKKLWEWDNREEAGRGRWRGQGAHTMHAADVDGDGRDEVIIGSAVVDDNGNGLWTTGLGHPDFIFVGDIDPLRPGLEIFYGIEPRHPENSLCLVDARTGQIIWGLKEPTTHVGTDGMCADIDIRYPGAECHAANIDKDRKYAKSWLFSARGELISDKKQHGFASSVYWDGDLQRELVRGSKIESYLGGIHPPGIFGRVALIADILGDWREELVTTAPGELRIYTTTIPATDRRVCLMQDPIYRIDVAEAAQGYWCAPSLRVLPSAMRAAMEITAPPDGVALQGETKCSVVLAAGKEALRGQLRFTAEGVSVSPTEETAEVPAEAVKEIPFSLRALPSSSLLSEILQAVPGKPAHQEATVRVALPLPAGRQAGEAALSAEATLPVPEPMLSGVPITEAEAFCEQQGGQVKVREDMRSSCDTVVRKMRNGSCASSERRRRGLSF
jgi:rhamnogalacturonan endolyase